MSKMQDAASNVGAEGGEVCVDGPDGVAYSMSPDAANETGNRLIKGAAQAQVQRDTREIPPSEDA